MDEYFLSENAPFYNQIITANKKFCKCYKISWPQHNTIFACCVLIFVNFSVAFALYNWAPIIFRKSQRKTASNGEHYSTAIVIRQVLDLDTTTEETSMNLNGSRTEEDPKTLPAEKKSN
ncbi:unnamed protein product [Caenorhabditis bovis]|uniref:Uncharacterized protein n=1 Tax=Caenorhabditis bovis TaxID=2654633 RepID=A0A8S1EIC0_9PELO|nr:unnamed protein product [Caenorhabditis bovis]